MAWTLTDVTTAVNLTAETDAQSVTIAHRAYAETSRLTARIIDEAGTLTLATEHEITLTDGGVTAFAGYIRVCKKADRGVSTQRVYEIEAQDYTTALGDDVIDSASGLRANGESDKARIAALGTAFGTRGISFGTASVVQLRAVMPDQDFRGLNLHQALSEICKITGGSFYVGFDKVLHYFNSEALSAPFNLSDAPNGSTTFGFDNFSLTDDTVQYVNAVYVVGTDIADWRPSAAAVATLRAAGTLRAMVVTNPEVIDSTTLALVGDAVLAQYGAVRKPSSLVTYQPGLRAGMTVQITHAGWGVSAATYRIASIEAQPVDANRIRYTVYFGSNPISLGDLLRQNSMSVAEAYLAGAGAVDAAVDAVLDLSAGGANLVPNSSFEDTTAWTPGTNWVMAYQSTPTADAYHGSKEARLVAAALDSALTSPFITVDRLDDYWVSGRLWCRAFTSGRVRLYVEEYNAAGTLLATTVVGESNALQTGWATYARRFSNVAAIGVTTWQATTAKIKVVIGTNGTASTGTWSADAIQVERGDLMTSYAPKPQEIVAGSITTTQIADDAITTPKLTSGAVVAGKIAAGAVTADTIAAQAVTAAKIAAGTITADKLAALLILASVIKTASSGKRVEIDSDGIRLLDSSNGLLVRIPTNTDPVYVSGQVEASSLVSVLTAELRGQTTISAGAVATLQVGVTDPSSAPAIVASVPTMGIDTPTQPGGGLCYDPAGDAGGATPTYWLGANPTIGNLLDMAYEYRASDGVLLRTLQKTGTSATYTATLGSTSHVSDTADATTGAGLSQIATPLTIPNVSNPRVTKVSIYATGYGGTCNTKVAVWSTGGTLLRESAAFTMPSEALSNGASNHYDQALTSELAVTPGGTYRVGFLRTSSGDGFQWDKDDGSSKTTYKGDGLDGNLTSVSTDTDSKPNVYLTYKYDVDSSLEGTTGYIVGIARVGTNLWLLDSIGWLYQYSQSTLAYIGKFDMTARVTGAKTSAGLFYDGTNIIITTQTGTGAGVQVRFVKLSTAGAFVSNLDATGYAINGTTTQVRGGYSDGTNYWVSLYGASNGVYAFNKTTGANVLNRDFGMPAEIAGGITWNGSQFVGWGSTLAANALCLFTGWDWTTESAVYWVGYTWYDITGTTHETAISPRATISMSRRRQLVVTTPSIPAGGVEPADRVRVYMARGAADPGGTGYALQSTDALTARTYTSFASGGAANPASNNFPVGTPAEIKSVSTGWSLKGDGTFTGLGIIGSGYLQHASVDTTVTGFGTAMSDMDATNLAATFTAPASGKVWVTVNATVAQVSSTTSGYLGVREGSTTLRQQIVTQGAVLGAYSVGFLVTGLTPGSSHTYKAAIGKATSGTMNFYHGPTFGAASIVVEAVA